MPDLKVLQSLWAMERRHTDGFERSLEENVGRIAGAGFAGVSARWTDRAAVRRLSGLLGERGLVAEGQCFPRTVDDLKPVLDIAAEFAVELLDLHVVLDLLDRFPELPLVADLSHVVVAREFPWPVPEEEHAKVRRVLDNARALHGRVASREQVQVEISYPHHRPWVDLFLGWWAYGLRRMADRLPAGRGLCFTCELGPKPYAITGRDGNDTTDRWAESLVLKAMVEQCHAGTGAIGPRERVHP